MLSNTASSADDFPRHVHAYMGETTKQKVPLRAGACHNSATAVGGMMSVNNPPAISDAAARDLCTINSGSHPYGLSSTAYGLVVPLSHKLNSVLPQGVSSA